MRPGRREYAAVMSARNITLTLLLTTSLLVACGTTPAPKLDDTWTWTGGDWHELSAPFGAHPGWRQDAVFVYDPAAKQVLMFGGEGPSTSCPNVTVCELGETWAWSGQWTRVDLKVAPRPRTAASAGYDPVTKQVIMFGGWAAADVVQRADVGNPIDVLTDTWAWDGSQWSQLAPLHSPPGGGPESMAWDSATKTLVMIAGASTWSWNGTDWTMHESADQPTSGIVYADDSLGMAMIIGPTGQFSWTGIKWVWKSPLTYRGDAGVAFNPLSTLLMSFGSGGCGGIGGNNAQTWVSADDGWQSLPTTTHPPARAGSYLAYDADIGGLVMFGGYQSWGCGGFT